MNLSILYKKLTNRKHTIGYKFILSILIGFIGIISFCSADIVSVGLNCYTAGSKNYCWKGNLYSQNLYLDQGDYLILLFDNNGLLYKSFSTYKLYISNDNLTTIVNYSTGSMPMIYNILSTGVPLGKVEFTFYGNQITFNGENYTAVFVPVSEFSSCSCPECPTCPTCNPQYTSEQCQSVYGLVSSGLLNTCENNYNNCQSDLNSCQSNTSGFNDLLNNCSNNLNACNNSLTNCLQQNCPETITGTNRSSLFINNIQYPGAPTIKFTIPEEIERDKYTDEEETNIDVVGYGYDQDKMQQMVNTQYYKPTAEEMSGLMEKVADFLPFIAIALLITRAWRVIKKVFKF